MGSLARRGRSVVALGVRVIFVRGSRSVERGSARDRARRVRAATREHADASGAGLVFDGYLAFEVILDRLLADRDLANGLALRGRRYVDDNFRWPDVIGRYRRLVEGVATA